MNKTTILVVDDAPVISAHLTHLLEDKYDVVVANDGFECLDLVKKVRPDIILLDILMPKLDGWEVCKQLKSNPKTSNIPIIFLSAKNSFEEEEYGLSIGAVDFISKPINPTIVKARIKTQLENKKYEKFLSDKTSWLEEEVVRKLEHIDQLHYATIAVMVSLAEFRDEDTGLHIKRTQAFVEVLAKELAKLPKYKAVLTHDFIFKMVKSAPLHDIGKIAIPDEILLKAGKLTEEEMEAMKNHVDKGVDILRKAQQYLEKDSDFLDIAIEIASYHHEKFDGEGYPSGLKGEHIPISARLMAVADVYDALRTVRPYKRSLSHEEAMEIITNGRGTHFDPIIVDILIEHEDEFRFISEKFKD